MSPTIHAVHDDDLEEFLKRINVLGKFTSGQINCSLCKETITRENLYSIFPDSGDIKFSCNKPECILALKTRIEGKNYA
jgi:hypothetical protein